MATLEELQRTNPNAPFAGFGVPQDAPAAPGGDDALFKLIAALINRPQPENPMAPLFARLANPDPVGERNRQWNQTGPGGGFDMAKEAGFFGAGLTPEARMASQGPTAQNQWAQLGGVQDIDPVALATLMAGMQRNTDGLPSPGVVTGRDAPFVSPGPAGASRLPVEGGGMEIVGQKPGMGGGNLLGFSTPGRNTTPTKPKTRPRPKMNAGYQFGGFR